MKTNIVETLTTNHVSKTKFALDFYLSRPTLDEYIAKFERNVGIPKERYQIIFNRLFGETLSPAEFKRRYYVLKNMFRRDKILDLDEIDVESTDTILFVIDSMKVDSKTTDKALLHFLNTIVSTYKEPFSISKMFAKYATYLNGFYDYDFTDNEKRYFGNLYCLNRAFLDNPETLNIENFKLLEERRKQLLDKNENRKREVEELLKRVIDRYVSDAVSNSKENETPDSIVDKVLERLKN